MDQADGETEALNSETIIADILARKISVFDLLRDTPSGDYWVAVQRTRLFLVLSRDPRVLKQLHEELRFKISEAGGDSDDGAIEKELAGKDGARRFDKLVKERNLIFDKQSPLLTGSTFEVCLEQYLALIAHVEKMWADACQLYTLGNYPLAAFVSILVIEEVGKLARLSQDLVFCEIPRAAMEPIVVEKSHRRKHFIGVVSGALINSRLDRVLGKDIVRKVLHQAESDELEKIRQSCLYVDIRRDRTVTPGEVIDGRQAQILAVLAGELMAEVLGHFPWEFERMIDNVIAFERSIGMAANKIDRQ